MVQDYSAGTRSEKIILGQVVLNLAEYVEESEGVDVEEGIVRRYLMQESKINSTLKIGITMKQLDGERNFVAPPLKTAPVFVGIAGIMTGEQVEQDELGSVFHPSCMLYRYADMAQACQILVKVATIPNYKICTGGL